MGAQEEGGPCRRRRVLLDRYQHPAAPGLSLLSCILWPLLIFDPNISLHVLVFSRLCFLSGAASDSGRREWIRHRPDEIRSSTVHLATDCRLVETDATERTNHTTGWTAQSGGRSTRGQRNKTKINNQKEYTLHRTIIHAQGTKQTKNKCGWKQRFQMSRNAWATERNSEPNKRIDRTFLSRHVFLKKKKTDSPIDRTKSDRQRHLAVGDVTTSTSFQFFALQLSKIQTSRDKLV